MSQVTEYLPNTNKKEDKICGIRSMTAIFGYLRSGNVNILNT